MQHTENPQNNPALEVMLADIDLWIRTNAETYTVDDWASYIREWENLSVYSAIINSLEGSSIKSRTDKFDSVISNFNKNPESLNHPFIYIHSSRTLLILKLPHRAFINFCSALVDVLLDEINKNLRKYMGSNL